MSTGCDTVRVPYTNSYDLTNIVGLFKRGVKIDINSYTRTVILWNYREWERSRKLTEKRNATGRIVLRRTAKRKNTGGSKTNAT